MSRREARTLAMKSLFSLDFTTDVSPLDTVKALLEDEDTQATASLMAMAGAIF